MDGAGDFFPEIYGFPVEGANQSSVHEHFSGKSSPHLSFDIEADLWFVYMGTINNGWENENNGEWLYLIHTRICQY